MHDHDKLVAMFGECIHCAANDITAGRAARDRAITAVADGAPERWLADAKRVVTQLAAAGQEFSTDACWLRLPKPPEPRAMGAVMRWAVDTGLVVNTGRTVQSTRPENHARPVTVWAPARQQLGVNDA